MEIEKEASSESLTKKKFYIVSSIIAVVILLIIAGLTYFTINDYTKKVNSLNNTLISVSDKLDNETAKLFSDIEQSKEQLTTRIIEEKSYSEEQRQQLEKDTLENLVKLENFVTQKTTTLKLDLESQLSTIEDSVDELEETSLELEDRISSLRISSSDFTAIIDDVIRAVVSVKTNAGQGSGVIYHPSGYIITNKHVIEGVNNIWVVDYNGMSHPVQILGFGVDVDLAVLKINSTETFDYLEFEYQVSVGQHVIAVGNPLGLSFTVTEGIISAVNRDIDDSAVGYIQTDVSINSGSSGGPLVNAAGDIVGINTLKIDATEGLGFAIPAHIVENIAMQALRE